MFFSIFVTISTILILFVFSKFLDKIINFQKAKFLIYIYIILIFLSIFTIILVLISSLKFLSQQNDFITLMNLGDTTLSSVFYLFLTRIGLFFVGILLGIKIMKINSAKSLVFKTLGILFIVDKIFAFLTGFYIIKTEIISGIINAGIVAVIGYILSIKFERQEKENKSFEPFINESKSRNKEILSDELENDYSTLQSNIDKLKQNDPIETKNIEEEKEDLNLLDFKNEAISYYDSLTDEEKIRLKYIIIKKNDSLLSESEIYKLVIIYIIEKKLFDNNRFAPK